MLVSNLFIVRPRIKDIVFIRTESGRFWKISNKQIITDRHIDENNGLIPKAVQVSASCVAELYARFGVNPKPKVKRKAFNMKRFQKEMV